ncbi:MAG: sugar nucleotide-binding protein [Bacteroidota bacterium]
MKILVSGSNGLLGQKLIKLLCDKGDSNVIATARNSNRLPAGLGDYEFASMDISNEESVNEVVAQFTPDVIINTAAMTNVDQCEQDREGCWQANVASTEYLVQACEKHGVHLVHVSTDFIFDGTEGPLKEDAVPNPVCFHHSS